MERLPTCLIVTGAGYIGVEFAQMYAQFGTEVTMLGRASRVMPHEDEEVSAALADVLRAEGFDLHTSRENTSMRCGECYLGSPHVSAASTSIGPARTLPSQSRNAPVE